MPLYEDQFGFEGIESKLIGMHGIEYKKQILFKRNNIEGYENLKTSVLLNTQSWSVTSLPSPIDVSFLSETTYINHKAITENVASHSHQCRDIFNANELAINPIDLRDGIKTLFGGDYDVIDLMDERDIEWDYETPKDLNRLVDRVGAAVLARYPEFNNLLSSDQLAWLFIEYEDYHNHHRKPFINGEKFDNSREVDFIAFVISHVCWDATAKGNIDKEWDGQKKEVAIWLVAFLIENPEVRDQHTLRSILKDALSIVRCHLNQNSVITTMEEFSSFEKSKNGKYLSHGQLIVKQVSFHSLLMGDSVKEDKPVLPYRVKES
jgi:hypothetical protein